MRTRIIDYLIKLGLKSGIFLRENKDHRLPYKIRIFLHENKDFDYLIKLGLKNKNHRLSYKISVRTRIIDYLIN